MNTTALKNFALAVRRQLIEAVTEDIPAVTQLFTPHWIVRYLVENSLGRLWLLNHPQSKLRDHMPYYIEGEEVATGGSPDFLKITKPEEIRLLDPAGGSGHMLTYAFDLLVLIYEEEGYRRSQNRVRVALQQKAEKVHFQGFQIDSVSVGAAVSCLRENCCT